MDISRFKVHDWLMVGGGLGFLIFGTFVSWLTFSGGGLSASDGNAFDFFLTGTVPWILIVGAGVLAFLLAADIVKPGNRPWPVILLAATALGTLLVLLRLLFPSLGEDLDALGIDVGRGAGLWLSALSAIVATVGAAMSFSANGGTMSDLTDLDRLRSSFKGSGGSPLAPPPPPSASGPSAPPPPPPAP